MKSLLLLAFIGSTFALKYPVEYDYKYEGRLATGIPGIRAMVAGLGIRATVHVQMKSATQGTLKLEDVQSGEFDGDLQCCNLRGPIPLKWSPMAQYKEQLEKEFVVNFQEEMGQVMEVDDQDIEFIVNIRKAIVESLRINPLIANEGAVARERLDKFASGDAPEAFYFEEETLFGRCESQYTISKVPEYSVEELKQRLKIHLKHDEQVEGASKTKGASIQNLGEEYYRVVRTIDFDKCNDRVYLQHTGISNTSEALRGQFKAIHSRSSVGTFILKGAPGNFRLESSIIEGDTIMNPFGYRTHRTQTITNSTMVLESAKGITRPFRVSSKTRDVRTWRYEVATSYPAPEGHPKPWVNYRQGSQYLPVNFQSTLLGLIPTPSMIDEYEKNLMQMLDDSVKFFYDDPSPTSTSNPSCKYSKESVATTNLHFMTRMMRIFPESKVDEIFSQVFSQKDVVGQRKQILLTDAAAASGATAPIKVLIKKMKSHEISPQRTATIFMTITNTLYSPDVIPQLVDFAKSWDVSTNPAVTSSVLINMAGLINRVCMDERRINYTLPNPIFGKEACNPSEMANSFLSYLKQKAEQTSSSYERTIFIQAIANFGSAEAMPILKPYIYGMQDSSPRVRISAIYGLTRRHMPDSMRQEVFDTLMKVVDNIIEETVIRQHALSALLTWHPDAAWWQRMARLTWKDPSPSMAAYITFTVQSLAMSTEPYLHRQARIASFVEPLLKPFVPSIFRSYHNIFSRFNDPRKVGVFTDFGYIRSHQEDHPSTIYFAGMENLGDLHLDIFEGGISYSGMLGNISDMMSSFVSREFGEPIITPSVTRSPSSRDLENFVSKMKNFVGMKRSSQDPMEADVYFRIFENMQYYLPINKDIIRKIAGEGGQNLINNLLRGTTYNVTKFISPVDIEYFIPTEIGLPILTTVSLPTVNKGDIEVRLFASKMQSPTIHDLMRAENITFLFKTNYKFVSKLLVKSEVPTPWNNKIVETGIDTTKQVNLPVNGNLTLSRTHEVKNLTINLAPFVHQKFPLVHANNLPYTQVRAWIPTSSSQCMTKVIAVQEDTKPVLQISKKFDKKYTGLDMEMEYSADAAYPFTYNFITQYKEHPEYIPQLLISPTSEQYQFTLHMTPQQSTRNVSVSLSLLYPTPRNARSSSPMPAFSSEDTVSQKLEKLRSLSDKQVYGINIETLYNGTEYRKYEVLAAFTLKSQSQQTEQYKAVLAFLTSRVPGFIQSPKALCTQAEMTTPHIPDFNALKQVVQSDPQESVQGGVYYGQNCASPEITTYKGSVKVSQERLSIIRKELDRICGSDEVNPTIELQTPAIYDTGNFEVHFAKDKIPQLLLNASYCAEDMIEGSIYPNGSYNHFVKGPQNQITAAFKRPLSSLGYTFWAALPQKYSILSEISLPERMTGIVPWSGLQTSYDQYSHLLIGMGLPETCHITKGQVMTYDHLNYTYNPLNCWTTVAIDSRAPDDFMVYSRVNASGEFEVKVVLPKDSVSALVSRSNVTVNGRMISSSQDKYVVKNREGKEVMALLRHSDYYQVEIMSKAIVKVMKEIQIKPYQHMRGHLRGVCGDFDGQPTFDLTGPKDCMYTDKELFKYAWSIPEGDHCDIQKLQTEQQKVRNFQLSCHKRPQNPTDLRLKSLYESEAVNCYQNVYPIKRKGRAVCVPMSPVKMCTTECSLFHKRESQQLCKCWMPSNVPSEVRKAEATGYLMHPITAPAKYRDQVEFTEATECRPH